MKKNSWKIRFLWILFNIAVLSLLLYVLEEALQDFLSKSLITVLHDPLYPVKPQQFPIVAICSVNRLSKKAVTKFAEELAARDPQNHDVVYFKEKLKLLSYLYSISSVDGIKDNELLALDKYLEDFEGVEHNVTSDFYQIFKMLTPKCEDLLLSCEIGGEDIPCASIIQTRNSEYGDCCVFNVSDPVTSKNIMEVFKEDYLFMSPDSGLTVMINTSTEDNFFTLFNTQDHIIHIYTNNKYDDGSSGGIIEKFVMSGEEMTFGVMPRYLASDDEVQNYGIENRKCLFAHEVPHGLGRNYGLNKCLTECRINSIKVLCKCIPFYYYDESMFKYEPNRYNKIQFCTLQHVSCLDKYKFKWINVVTERIKSKELEKEMEDSLYCPQCFALCKNTQIKVSVMSLPIRQGMFESKGLSQDMKITDLAVLRFFYKEASAKYYKQTLKNFWFEIFSTIGGICGLMTGLSFGALCQIIHFIIITCEKIYLISIK